MEANRIEKESTSTDMGTRARSIKSLLQTCTQLAAITRTPIIITNHVYDNPGDMHPSLIKTMSGGKSTIYMPSISVQISRKPVKEDEIKSELGSTAALQRNYVGILLRALTAKNRFVKQYLQGEIYLSFNTGVDKYYGLLELAVELDVLQQTGSTYMFNGEKIGYAKSFVNDNSFWEDKIIPLLQKKVDVAWTYSNEQDKEIKKMEAEASTEGGEEV
jgi:recombination protein RecA